MVLRQRQRVDDAAACYALAADRSPTPSRYLQSAIAILITAEMPKEAGQYLTELCQLPRNETWLIDFEQAVSRFTRIGKQNRVRQIAQNFAGSDKREVAGLLLLYAGFKKEAYPYLAEIDWPKHPLSKTKPVRLLALFDEARDDIVAYGSSRIEDLLSAVPASLKDFALARRESEISTIDIFRTKKGKGPFTRRLGNNICIITEPEVSLERVSEFVSTDEETEIVVLANGDSQARQAEEMGWQAKSLREIIPDQSPIIDTLYAHAEKIARTVVNTLLQGIDDTQLGKFLAQHQQTFEMLLEDRVARELHNLESCLTALRTMPPTTDFLFVTSQHQKFVNLLPWLAPQVDPQRLFLLGPEGTYRVRGEYVETVKEFSDTGRLAGSLPTWITGRVLASTLEIAAERYDRWRDKFAPRVTEVAADDCANLRAKTCLFLANLVDRNYGNANCELALRLGEDHPMFLLGTLESFSSHWSDERPQSLLADSIYQSLQVICRDRVSRAPGYEAGVALSQRLMKTESIQALTYLGRPIWRVIASSIYNWARLDVAMGAIEDVYLQHVLAHDNISNLVVSPGRGRAPRMAAVIAAEHNIKSVDIQMVNTPAYRKYKTPITDVVTSIDDIATNLYTTYFGVGPERVYTVGSPKLDMFRNAVARCDQESALADAGLRGHSGSVICFASQIQPIGVCLEIVESLISCIVDQEHLALIIKMHPREDEAREHAYRRLIRQSRAAGRIVLLRDFDMDRIYAISQTLVTMYSNAAREALVLGRQVIIANFTGKPWPMRFDLPGMATGAYSPQQLKKLITDGPSDEADADIRSIDSENYISRNNHLLEHRACDLIAGLLETPKDLLANQIQ